MSSDRQTLMAELYDKTMKDIKEGEIVKGTIVAVTNKEAIVDIGFKSEGFVPIEEFRERSEIQIGNKIDVLIESIEDEDGRLILSKQKAERAKGWSRVMNDVAEGEVVEGYVTKIVKGGYMVDVEGVEGFLPMSLSAFKGVSNQEITSHKYKFQVANINKQRRNLILSQRDVVQK